MSSCAVYILPKQSTPYISPLLLFSGLERTSQYKQKQHASCICLCRFHVSLAHTLCYQDCLKEWYVWNAVSSIGQPFWCACASLCVCTCLSLCAVYHLPLFTMHQISAIYGTSLTSSSLSPLHCNNSIQCHAWKCMKAERLICLTISTRGCYHHFTFMWEWNKFKI